MQIQSNAVLPTRSARNFRSSHKSHVIWLRWQRGDGLHGWPPCLHQRQGIARKIVGRSIGNTVKTQDVSQISKRPVWYAVRWIFRVQCASRGHQTEQGQVHGHWNTAGKVNNNTQVKQFLGTLNYCWMFMGPPSLNLAKTLVEPTRKNQSFEWIEEHMNSVRALKHQLINFTILQIPDPSKPYVIKRPQQKMLEEGFSSKMTCP